MVMPLYDHNPFKWPTPPYVTWLLIAINIIVFLLQSDVSPDQSDKIDHVAALVPAAFTGAGPAVSAFPAPFTLVTYMFLHANFLHVFGNMIFLWVFGDDIEEALGHWRYLAFYLACGVAGGLAFVLSNPTSDVELVGASGAIAGVIAAYAMFRPCAKVTVLLSLLILRIRAYWVIGGWVLLQVYEIASQAEDDVAYWAHIGGLAVGAILFTLMRPPGIQLFECVDPAQVATPGPIPPPR
jgi:membrane associated rhomboid family serine protease